MVLDKLQAAWQVEALQAATVAAAGGQAEAEPFSDVQERFDKWLSSGPAEPGSEQEKRELLGLK